MTESPQADSVTETTAPWQQAGRSAVNILTAGVTQCGGDARAVQDLQEPLFVFRLGGGPLRASMGLSGIGLTWAQLSP